MNRMNSHILAKVLLCLVEIGNGSKGEQGLNYFYGILLLVLGAIILVRYIFKIELPVFKISLGLLLILIGVSFFTNNPEKDSEITVIFGNKTIQVVNPEKNYTLLFAKGTVDLSKIPPRSGVQKIKINTIFSSGTILTASQVPTLVKMNSAFSVAEMPDSSKISLGNCKYATASYKKELPSVEVEARVVFGQLKVLDNGK
jgi:predicted membrane protein